MILDKIKTVTDKPITTIINTHTHGDHTGSNEFFGTSVEFVAHENTKTNMEKMDDFKGDKSVFLPKKTFKDKLTHRQGHGRDRPVLLRSGPHERRRFVVFKELRVMHAGDAFAGKRTPIIDAQQRRQRPRVRQDAGEGGSAIKNVDTIITGHSPLMTPADLKEFAEFNNDFGQVEQAQMKAGKTVDRPQQPNTRFRTSTQGLSRSAAVAAPTCSHSDGVQRAGQEIARQQPR